jgi:hypothetical protein
VVSKAVTSATHEQHHAPAVAGAASALATILPKRLVCRVSSAISRAAGSGRATPPPVVGGEHDVLVYVAPRVDGRGESGEHSTQNLQGEKFDCFIEKRANSVFCCLRYFHCSAGTSLLPAGLRGPAGGGRPNEAT